MICWRGERLVNTPVALVRTASSSQEAVPLNMPGPKARVTVKRPLLTAVAVLVSAPAAVAGYRPWRAVVFHVNMKHGTRAHPVLDHGVAGSPHHRPSTAANPEDVPSLEGRASCRK